MLASGESRGRGGGLLWILTSPAFPSERESRDANHSLRAQNLPVRLLHAVPILGLFSGVRSPATNSDRRWIVQHAAHARWGNDLVGEVVYYLATSHRPCWIPP